MKRNLIVYLIAIVAGVVVTNLTRGILGLETDVVSAARTSVVVVAVLIVTGYWRDRKQARRFRDKP